jgi:hypothetical protein
MPIAAIADVAVRRATTRSPTSGSVRATIGGGAVELEHVAALQLHVVQQRHDVAVAREAHDLHGGRQLRIELAQAAAEPLAPVDHDLGGFHDRIEGRGVRELAAQQLGHVHQHAARRPMASTWSKACSRSVGSTARVWPRRTTRSMLGVAAEDGRQFAHRAPAAHRDQEHAADHLGRGAGRVGGRRRRPWSSRACRPRRAGPRAAAAEKPGSWRPRWRSGRTRR